MRTAQRIFLFGFIILTLNTSNIWGQVPYYHWSSPFIPDAASNSNNYSANDAAGNVYSVGTFNGTVDFDPGPGVLNITSSAAKDLFLTKLDPMGNLVWIRTFNGGASSQCIGRSIAISPGGNIVFTSTISGTVDFDPGPGVLAFTGGGSIIGKFDPNGNLIWAKQIDGPTGANSELTSVAVDFQGGVYITGYFSGAANTDFDPGPGTINRNTSGAGDFDGFLLKLDSVGVYQWVKTFTGSGGTCHSRSVAVDPLGSYVYVTGQFQDTHDFNPTGGSYNLNSSGNFDAFVARYNCSTGNFGWAKKEGGTQRDVGNDITVDGSGNPIITGHFQGTANGMFSVNAGAGFYGVYVAKINSAGNNIWIKSLASDVSIESPQVCRDNSNNVYLSGYLYGTVDFDPNAGIFNITNPGSYPQSFITKWDNNSNFIWAGHIISLQSEIHSLTCNNSGGVYASGFVAGLTDFDPGSSQSLTSSPTNNLCGYVVKWGDCELPNISTQPVNINICEGDNTTFSISATGTNLIYQWQVDTGSGFTNLSNIPPYSNVSSPTLNITNTNSGMNGYLYRCVVGGTCGTPINSNNAQLIVNSAFNTSPTISICNGDTYMLGSQTLNISGTYNETFSSINGCDSMVTLTLNVNPTYNMPVTTFICNGDSYILGTQTITSAGTYNENFSSINGCDSMVTLTLNVNPTYNMQITTSICNGDSYILGTQTITSAGIYNENFSSINGCDSMVTLTLNVNTTYNIPITTSICNGDSYVLGTQTITTAGTYNETFSSINGCDSMVTLTLNVNPTYNIPVTTSICNGDSYVLGTQTITSAGIYNENFSSINGCDSMVTLTLNVNMINTNITQSGNTLTANIASANYQWIDCTANTIIIDETSQTFTPAISGSYGVIITQGSCSDTSICIDITNLGLIGTNDNDIQIYPNPVESYLNIKSESSIDKITLYDISGKIIKIYHNLGNGQILLDFIHLTSGTYILELTTNLEIFRTRVLKN